MEKRMLFILSVQRHIYIDAFKYNTSRCVLIVQLNHDLNLIPPALNSAFTVRVTDAS